MSYSLGIDTSYEVAVGIAKDGVPLDSIVVANTRAHAEALMPSIMALCAQHGIAPAGLSEVAVGMGPGPFTGLRVGIVTAGTIAALLGVPPRGVCSLDVLARQWVRAEAPREFVIASDARRKEVYWARYVDGVRAGDPQVSAPEDVPALPIAGPAIELYPQLCAPVPGQEFRPREHSPVGLIAPPERCCDPRRLDAAVLAADWALLAPVGEPLYLRAADATVSTRTKSALPRIQPRRR